MIGLVHTDKKYTLSEYFELDNNSMDNKYEFYDGEIVTIMPGTTKKHNRIIRNFNRIFDKQSTCEVYFESLRLQVLPDKTYVYPDLMLVCDDNNDPITATNPVLVVEVLSPSSIERDTVKKLHYYKQISTLLYYLIVSQNEPHIEFYFRENNKEWQHKAYELLNTEINLKPLAITLKLQDIYNQITF